MNAARPENGHFKIPSASDGSGAKGAGNRGGGQAVVVCETAAGAEAGRPRGHTERGQVYLKAAPFSLPVGLGRAAGVSLCAPFSVGVRHA